jgi:hypothetical protein
MGRIGGFERLVSTFELLIPSLVEFPVAWKEFENYLKEIEFLLIEP